MKAYGIPTDQYAKYSTSVHQEALAVRGDLSAPTCTTCHGNHGAAPPGVDKVQNVCATCHVFQAQLYGKSPHFKAFQAASLPGCVVCHSNHGIQMPSDAMLGAGPAGVCTSCHKPGDQGDQARAGILAGLTQLDQNITNADQALHLAESSGMEVSTALLSQDQARDSLTKARVTVHSLQPDLVNQDVQAGLKIAVSNEKAGKDAMIERNHRRIGLGLCLIAIAIMLAGLWLYLREIESRE
jgi:predicted CXXCH cytochrome family protein